MGDYDVRGQDLRQHYAGFGRLPLTEGAVWALALAQSVVNESLPNHIGYKAWITDVAGVDCFIPEMQAWAVGLADSYATLAPLRRQRRRRLVANYSPAWGHRAALDGLQMVVVGKASVPSLRSRSESCQCGLEPYQRVRNFVAGVIALQCWQFEDALGWAVRLQRRS